VVKRRERTRQLIELGGLIAKAGLIELTGDDRAVIFGLLVEAVAKLSEDDREEQLVLWRRRGKRAFNLQRREDRPGCPHSDQCTSTDVLDAERCGPALLALGI
jgi:hypothetical protein